MNRRRGTWGAIAVLTIGLMTPLLWQGRPVFPIKNAMPAEPENRQVKIQSLEAKKNRGNESAVAKDIAHTAALCVRDCRVMLTEMSNELMHTTSTAERIKLLEHHMKQHPQFVSLTLRDAGHRDILLGNPLRPDLQDQAHHLAMTDNFYISDLYHKKAADPKEHIGMTVGVPVLSGKRVTGTLTADVEMGHLQQVMRTQDQIMGTRTNLIGMDGNSHLVGLDRGQAKGGVSEAQVTSKKAESKIDGTAWKVHVTSVQDRGSKTQHMPQEVLARFNRSLSPTEISRICHDIKGMHVRSNAHNTYVFRLGGATMSEAVLYLKNNGARIAEPNTRLHPNSVASYTAGGMVTAQRVVEQPNDTFYGSNQWNLPLIGADKAWQISTGNPHVTIAVVDTGVDLNHPEFEGQLVEGHNVIDPSSPPQDDNGHGTHVAGIIAARTNNLEGIAGIDWAGKIMPVKTMAADGSGSVVDIADGIVWAADHGANVINLSLGEYSDSDYLHDAVRYAYDKGAVIVAAMGNDGVSDPSYPAAYEEVIGVAADDDTTETASFSNYGAHTSVTAPGVAIPSTFLDRRYVALSGTSMASPHVAGVAALIKSINPDLSPKEVRKILESTADDLGPEGHDEYYGYGQINVAKALEAATNSKNAVQQQQ